jgi:hypothetical protein
VLGFDDPHYGFHLVDSAYEDEQGRMQCQEGRVDVVGPEEVNVP